jgi:branched-subunit amino acid transport protein
MNIWLIIALAGAGTFAIRLSMLVFVHPDSLPAIAREALRFVSPAVMAAIILPAVLYPEANADLQLVAGNERIFAALLAAAVAWATRNVWLTIALGMAGLWAIKALGG